MQVNAAPLSPSPCLERPAGQPTGTPRLLTASYVQSSVWTFDLARRTEQNVVFGFAPSWAPDGSWLAFKDGTSDGLHFRGSLCAIRTDFTRVSKLAPVFSGDVSPFCQGNGRADWSSDGGLLVYEGLDEIMYTISPDGGISSNLTLTHGLGPAWSPDGQRVAFTWPIRGGSGGCAVWVVYEDDRERHEQLTVVESPVFSPDGTRLAFVRGDRLMISDAQGNDAEVVVDVAPLEDQYETPRQLVWSPDGQRVAYVYDSPGGGWARVFIVEARGNAKLKDIAEGTDPSWSPDGERIAFSRNESEGKCSVFIADSDGTDEPDRVTSGCDPDWSPDGTLIAFAR